MGAALPLIRLVAHHRANARRASDRHLGSHLHHPAGREMEEVGGVRCRAGEPDEQPVLPARHAGMGRHLDRTARQEERRRHDVEGPAELAGDRERLSARSAGPCSRISAPRGGNGPTPARWSRGRFPATRGVSAKTIVRMTLCSCSTLLCLRLCSSAVGANSGSLVRKTAVPGAMCGGFFSRLATSVSSGTSTRRVFCARIAVPRRQVIIASTISAPNSTGSQAPSPSFSRAATKIRGVDDDEGASSGAPPAKAATAKASRPRRTPAGSPSCW